MQVKLYPAGDLNSLKVFHPGFIAMLRCGFSFKSEFN
jgi:hypothetical protein